VNLLIGAAAGTRRDVSGRRTLRLHPVPSISAAASTRAAGAVRSPIATSSAPFRRANLCTLLVTHQCAHRKTALGQLTQYPVGMATGCTHHQNAHRWVSPLL